MKVMLALCLFAVIFTLVFPVAAAMGPRSQPPEDTAATEDRPPESPASDGLFYVEDRPASPDRDDETTVKLLRDGKIEELSLTDYLIGAMSAEMPATFEPEALKAQAVALRTYYLRKASLGSSAHPEAQICADSTCCAAFRDEEQLKERWGESFETNFRKISAAVRATDGLYIAYDGEPALAVFHSSSAGRTEDCGEIWNGPVPYLVSVESPESADTVPGYVASVTVSAEEFRETVLEKYPSAVFGEDMSGWVTEPAYSASGRLSSVTVGGVSVPATSLRSMFGLRSTAVEIEVKDGSVTMTTTGYGHGVGMSQYGANTMAANGADFTEILSHYYPGTTLAGL